MHDTGALGIPGQRDLGVRATSQYGSDLSSHIDATSGTAIGVASRVGWVVDALKRKRACTEVVEKLSEHRRASNGANVASLAGAASVDDGQSSTAGVAVDVRGCGPTAVGAPTSAAGRRGWASTGGWRGATCWSAAAGRCWGGGGCAVVPEAKDSARRSFLQLTVGDGKDGGGQSQNSSGGKELHIGNRLGQMKGSRRVCGNDLSQSSLKK